MILLTILGVLLLPSMASAQVAEGKIAFSVVFRGNASLESGAQVKYPEVITNHGGAYSKGSGRFTVPRNGLYVFNIHALTQTGKTAWIELHWNDTYVVSAYARDTDGQATAENTAVLRLVKGDQIHVKVRKATDLYGSPSEVHVTFSGFILGLLSIPEAF